MLGELSEKMELKMKELDEERLLIKKWGQENAKLKEENERLKNEIKNINC